MAEDNQRHRGPAVSSQARVSGEETKRQQVGSRPARPVAGGDVLHETKRRLRTVKQDTDEYIRKNPAKAVFTALGIGFVLGLMRRR